MGWVVKSWRSDALEMVRNTAARETADARAYLQELEEMGLETRRLVHEQRQELRARREPPPPPRRVERQPAAPPERARREPPPPRRLERAVLRESPLTELFRATAQG
jgi:hypothetical protein